MPLKVASAAYTKNTNIPSVSNSDEMQANAKLIAAAPEMLTELQDVLDNVLIDFPDDDPRKVRIKELIKKATP